MSYKINIVSDEPEDFYDYSEEVEYIIQIEGPHFHYDIKQIEISDILPGMKIKLFDEDLWELTTILLVDQFISDENGYVLIARRAIWGNQDE
jgi:hypothetical protein